MKHVCGDCVCIRKVLEMRVIHEGWSQQAALAVTNAIEGGRVTPERC